MTLWDSFVDAADTLTIINPVTAPINIIATSLANDENILDTTKRKYTELAEPSTGLSGAIAVAVGGPAVIAAKYASNATLSMVEGKSVGDAFDSANKVLTTPLTEAADTAVKAAQCTAEMSASVVRAASGFVLGSILGVSDTTAYVVLFLIVAFATGGLCRSLPLGPMFCFLSLSCFALHQATSPAAPLVPDACKELFGGDSAPEYNKPVWYMKYRQMLIPASGVCMAISLYQGMANRPQPHAIGDAYTRSTAPTPRDTYLASPSQYPPRRALMRQNTRLATN